MGRGRGGNVYDVVVNKTNHASPRARLVFSAIFPLALPTSQSFIFHSPNRALHDVLMTRPSTRAVGDAFEAFSARFLNTDLRMSLRVVGGKSDGGVDLRGDWWLPLRLVSRPLQDYSVHLPTQQRAPVPRGYGYPTHHARRLAQLHADALLKAEFVKIVATAAPEPKFEHLVAKVALIAEEADDEYMDFALNHPYMATPSVTTSDDPPPPTFIEPPGLIEKDGHWLPNPFEISPVRVVGQCKAEAKATGPKHIRELEGVLDALSSG